MLTLSFGYLKPENGDKGSIWFPALADDIQQLNDHDHDGLTSAKLTSQSIIGVADTISHLNWVATTGGTYRQAVTTPAGVAFDDYGMVFRITGGGSDGFEINPTVEKITNTTYYVYINDNTKDLRVIYLA